MRLAEGREGEVVRNRRNGSYYRYERPEANRTRIRPLELFPNGLLIPKSADTIVESTLEVDRIGRWCDEFFVDEPSAEKLRDTYSTELQQKREELVVLEAEMATIDPNKHGGRGSHANKIKAVVRRVESLERGLAERSKDVKVISSSDEQTEDRFKPKQLVQLPSGLPGIIVGAVGTQVSVGMKTPTGQKLVRPLDPSVLRPLEHRYLATV